MAFSKILKKCRNSILLKLSLEHPFSLPEFPHLKHDQRNPFRLKNQIRNLPLPQFSVFTPAIKQQSTKSS